MEEDSRLANALCDCEEGISGVELDPVYGDGCCVAVHGVGGGVCEETRDMNGLGMNQGENRSLPDDERDRRSPTKSCGVYKQKKKKRDAEVGYIAHEYVPAAVPCRVGVRAHGPPEPLARKHTARRPGLPLAQAPPPCHRSPLRRVFQSNTFPPTCRMSTPVPHTHILHRRIPPWISPRARSQLSPHQAMA